MKIYDDTSRGEDFEITKILYEDEESILADAINEERCESIRVLIDKKSREVACNNPIIDFYLFEK